MGASVKLHRLNALQAAREVDPGYYADGGGLHLQISQTGSRSWIFRYQLAKRSREMGLGPLSSISLAEARAEAARCRKLLFEGVDPIDVRRRAERERAAQAAPAVLVFSQAAADYIAGHKGSWKSKKHGQQWENTRATYAYPILGRVDVRDVDTSMVVRVLQPNWLKKPETANCVRGRIEAVLDAAKALGKRQERREVAYRQVRRH